MAKFIGVVRVLTLLIAIFTIGIVDARAQQTSQAAAEQMPTTAFLERDVTALLGGANSLQYIIEQIERQHAIDLEINDVGNYRLSCKDGEVCTEICVIAQEEGGCSCSRESKGSSAGCRWAEGRVGEEWGSRWKTRGWEE